MIKWTNIAIISGRFPTLKDKDLDIDVAFKKFMSMFNVVFKYPKYKSSALNLILIYFH